MFWEDPGQRRLLTSQHAASPLMAQEDARWTHPSSFLFLELTAGTVHGGSLPRGK